MNVTATITSSSASVIAALVFRKSFIALFSCRRFEKCAACSGPRAELRRAGCAAFSAAARVLCCLPPAEPGGRRD
jgi:hypothetical protein